MTANWRQLSVTAVEAKPALVRQVCPILTGLSFHTLPLASSR